MTWLRERPRLTAVMTVGVLLAVGLTSLYEQRVQRIETFPEGFGGSLPVPSSPFGSSGGAGESAGAPVETPASTALPAGPAIARTARLQLTTLDFDKARVGVERMVSDPAVGSVSSTSPATRGRAARSRPRRWCPPRRSTISCPRSTRSARSSTNRSRPRTSARRSSTCRRGSRTRETRSAASSIC